MGMPFFGASVGYMAFLEAANFVFVFLFALEAALKIAAFGRGYFTGARQNCQVVVPVVVVGQVPLTRARADGRRTQTTGTCSIWLSQFSASPASRCS